MQNHSFFICFPHTDAVVLINGISQTKSDDEVTSNFFDFFFTLHNSKSDRIIKTSDQNDKEGKHLCNPKQIEAYVERAISNELFKPLKVTHGLKCVCVSHSVVSDFL